MHFTQQLALPCMHIAKTVALKQTKLIARVDAQNAFQWREFSPTKSPIKAAILRTQMHSCKQAL